MIAWSASRRDATAAEIEAALERLDEEPGLYFGCDAGIPGMHPLQATLAVAPLLALRVHGDGIDARATGSDGAAVLAHPALAAWLASARRGAGTHPVAALRALLQCFAPGTGPCLVGALRFESHRLRRGADAGTACLGSFFLPGAYWERGADGSWQHVALQFDVPPAAHGGGQAVPAAPPPSAAPTAVADDLLPGGYAEMVRQATTRLRDSPLVSLTLSQSYRRAVQVRASEAFGRLRKANPAPATFFFNDGAGERAFGASPDLQLVVRGRVVESMPVCGTVARRPGPVGESESLRELFNEEVDAASLAVCSDAMREDLAPCCEPGTLELVERRRPMSLATVVHAVDRLRGRLRAESDAWDAMLATTAPAMLTGAPRGAALQAIAALEKSARGWYGGLVMRMDRDGDALVGTLLRAAVLHDGWAEVRTGGDLLADSDPTREEAESRHKALSLWRALGVEKATAVAGGPPSTSSSSALRVRLLDAGGPFPHAIRDALQAIGVDAAPGSGSPWLLAGGDEQRCTAFLAQHSSRGVALGDAACRLLSAEGATLASALPAHGRTLTCTATDAMPPGWPRTFVTARYAQLSLAGDALPAGWTVWARDAQGMPVLAAHESTRRICLLFRPDSVLSDAAARAVLRQAIAFASEEPSAA